MVCTHDVLGTFSLSQRPSTSFYDSLGEPSLLGKLWGLDKGVTTYALEDADSPFKHASALAYPRLCTGGGE